ncbi:DMT family transporter [Leucothrix sargassi]|nr:DMT family transporter [Leucothrix sargassi]
MPINALIIVAMTTLLWGFPGVFIRLLPDLPPLTVTAGRIIAAMLFLLPLLLLTPKSRRAFKATLKRPIAYLLAMHFVVYYLFSTGGFQMAPIAEVALLVGTSPMFVFLFRLMMKDIPTRREVIGASCAMLGIVIIMGPNISFEGEMSSQRIIGDLLGIASAMAAASYATIYRRLNDKDKAPDTLSVSLLTFVLGSVISVLLVALIPTPSNVDTIDSFDLLMLVGLGVISTALTTYGFAIASKDLPSVVTSTAMLATPCFAGLFAYLIVGETLSPLFIPGGIMVLGGIALIVTTTKSAKKARIDLADSANLTDPSREQLGSAKAPETSETQSKYV